MLFDPTSFLSPTLLQGKVLLHQTWEGECKELLWDSPLPRSVTENFIQSFVSLYKLEEIDFHQNLWPQDAIKGEPEIVIFSDGSIRAFGAVV